MICAIDFETYYDNEVSITTLGVYHYLRHPQADLYLVSIATDTGIRYVGDPLGFDWHSISGPDCTWLSHNAQFDLPVFQRIQEIAEEKNLVNIPQHLEISAWHDTADLSAFLGVPRSLKEAAGHLLGIKLSKDVRDKMKGERWELMTPEFREDVCKYAMDDAVYCLEIFLKHGHLWPEHERQISQMTRSMALRGVPLDIPGLDEDIIKLEHDLWKIRSTIPWRDHPHYDPKKSKKDEKMPLLSAVALREECSRNGLEAPKSFAQDDPEAEKFFEKYSEQFPWIRAVRDYRKGCKHLATLKTMRERERGDGWMTYGLKYFGAHTGRDSGETGWNAQNLPKGSVCGVDIRSKVKAPEGHTFAIVDLSQIEPRCLHWLVEDTKTLDYIRQIPDLYEAQARAWGIWNGEGSMKKVAPDVRHQMKQLALGLGYGMGAKKFASVADIPPEEAERLTNLYRAKNPKITQLWRDLDSNLKKSAVTGTDAEMEFPSGRVLKYRKVSIGVPAAEVAQKKTALEAEEAKKKVGITSLVPRQGKLMRLGLWGGVCCENLVQGVARDVFMHHCLKIEASGIPVIMRVHDEVVCLVPEESAQEKLNQIISIMSEPPEWAPGLPLAAEGSLSKVYKK
jgi:DNA polymerase family A/3'-5' exonuclease